MIVLNLESREFGPVLESICDVTFTDYGEATHGIDSTRFAEALLENLKDYVSDANDIVSPESTGGPGDLSRALALAIGCIWETMDVQGAYVYASSGTVYQGARRAFSSHGLALIPVDKLTTNEGATVVRIFDLVHRSGESRRIRVETPLSYGDTPSVAAHRLAADEALLATLRDLLLLPEFSAYEAEFEADERRITGEGLDILEGFLISERKGETEEEKKARRDGQDPSWEKDRPVFCEALKKRFGLGYDRVSAYSRFVIGRGSPSSWPLKWRQAFVERISCGGYPDLYSPRIQE